MCECVYVCCVLISIRKAASKKVACVSFSLSLLNVLARRELRVCAPVTHIHTAATHTLMAVVHIRDQHIHLSFITSLTVNAATAIAATITLGEPK